MNSNISRREMLFGLGAATVVCTAGGIFAPLEAVAGGLPPVTFDDVAEALEMQFNFRVDLIGDTRLSDPTSALEELYSFHGLRWNFSDRVNFREARQCEGNFRGCENVFRSAGHNRFTDVSRSRHDSDIAFMTAAQVGDGYIRSIRGSTQFQGDASQHLMGDDPGIVLAGKEIYDEIYDPSVKNLARSTAVRAIVPQSTRVPGGTLQGRAYLTPETEVFHYPYPVQSPRRTYSKGIVGIRNLRTNDSMKFKGLYM